MTAAVTPADGAVAVTRDTKIVATFTVTAGVYSTASATLSCDGQSIALAATTDLTAKKVTFAPTAPLPYKAACTGQVLGTATGVDGGAQASTNTRIAFTVEQITCSTGQQAATDGQTCVPIVCPPGQVLSGNSCVASWWPPKSIAPMGTKVLSSSLNQLPAGCLSFTAECFKNLVAEGKMAVINTTAVMTGMPPPDNRALVTLVYMTPSGKMQLTLFFADNGEVAVRQVIEVDASDPFDWVVGNDRGYILKRSVDGTCMQWKWNYNPATGKGLFWDYEGVACPT